MPPRRGAPTGAAECGPGVRRGFEMRKEAPPETAGLFFLHPPEAGGSSPASRREKAPPGGGASGLPYLDGPLRADAPELRLADRIAQVVDGVAHDLDRISGVVRPPRLVLVEGLVVVAGLAERVV